MRLNPRPEPPLMTLNTQFEPAHFLVLPVLKTGIRATPFT